MTTSPRSSLLAAAEGFCSAFSRKADIAEILEHFSTTHQVTVIEHGDSSLVPFLGKPFLATPGVQKYFETIGSLLSYEEMKFSGFTVDVESRRVACRGDGKFTWLSTGESWNETFAYMLDFDDENKLTDYQVWADSGSAYLASQGQLQKVKEGLVNFA